MAENDGLTLYTIVHSNTPVEVLLDGLLANAIELLVDVRQFPRSRRNPQYNSDALARTLTEQGIEYRHLVALGGRRPVAPDSINTGLREAGFRGFADYMATQAFEMGLAELIEAGRARRTAFMCAEAVPWRCHRSLISDALVARGVRVQHIGGVALREHALSPYAQVGAGGRVTYPGLL